MKKENIVFTVVKWRFSTLDHQTAVWKSVADFQSSGIYMLNTMYCTFFIFMYDVVPFSLFYIDAYMHASKCRDCRDVRQRGKRADWCPACLLWMTFRGMIESKEATDHTSMLCSGSRSSFGCWRMWPLFAVTCFGFRASCPFCLLQALFWIHTHWMHFE